MSLIMFSAVSCLALYLIQGTIFGGSLLNIQWRCCCLYNFVWKASYSKYKSARYYHKCQYTGVHARYLLLSITVQQDATMYSLLYFCKLLYMFRVVTPPIIRSTYNCNYSIWHWYNFGKCSIWSQLKMRGMDRTVSAIFHDRGISRYFAVSSIW
jgi:hypothetical protein